LCFQPDDANSQACGKCAYSANGNGVSVQKTESYVFSDFFSPNKKINKDENEIEIVDERKNFKRKACPRVDDYIKEKYRKIMIIFVSS